jgi:hypothetical protein
MPRERGGSGRAASLPNAMGGPRAHAPSEKRGGVPHPALPPGLCPFWPGGRCSWTSARVHPSMERLEARRAKTWSRAGRASRRVLTQPVASNCRSPVWHPGRISRALPLQRRGRGGIGGERTISGVWRFPAYPTSTTRLKRSITSPPASLAAAEASSSTTTMSAQR